MQNRFWSPASFVCQCGYGVRRLFFRYGHLACRHCHRLAYASQQRDRNGRKRLAAAKLRLTQLGGWPDITEPLPPKAKWKHHQRYHRLRNQVQELEAQAKQTRFRKQIDIRTFSLHALLAMNIMRLMVFLALGMLLGMLLSSLASWLLG